jgi:LmbE family N-acetylglucosaminyl deacetylase
VTRAWPPFVEPDVPLLVVSPHLDDAVLSAYGFLRRPGTTVMTVFSGIPAPGVVNAWDTGLGFSDGHEAMLARRAEDQGALDALGVPSIRLPLLDGAYRHGPLTPEDLETARGAVQDWLRAADRRGIVLLPVGAGGRETLLYRIRWRSSMPGVRVPGGGLPHPDHQMVRDALLEHVLMDNRVVLYEELPYRWSGRGDRAVDLLVKQARFDRPVRFEVRIDRAAKAAAVARYRSQTAGVFRPWVHDLAAVIPASERYWLVEPRHDPEGPPAAPVAPAVTDGAAAQGQPVAPVARARNDPPDSPLTPCS